MECNLCNDSEIVKVQGDVMDRKYPCPACRIREFCVVRSETELSRQTFRNELAYFDDRQVRAVKEQLARDLVNNAVDVIVEAHPQRHITLYRARLLIILPKTKGD